MTPYEELTRRGRIRRMRQVAKAALIPYGLSEARLRFHHHAGNTVFRIHASERQRAESGEGLFEEGQYLLRIHEPGYQEPDAIEFELSWLAAMRRQVDLPVPEPIATADGRLLSQVSLPGVPRARNCSLLRWVRGRSMKKGFMPCHLRAQGRLMARLHDFSEKWQPPACPVKRNFDWDGLFHNDVGSGMRNEDAWRLLSPEHTEAFAFVAERVGDVMDDWGKGREVFGLIHGDLCADTNLLFWHGEPRAIDFDDSGFGYWVFDLAVALDPFYDSAAYPAFRKALLEGYGELRPLPDEQEAKMELFLAALQVYWNLWATGGVHLYPKLRKEYGERMASTAKRVVRFARSARALK